MQYADDTQLYIALQNNRELQNVNDCFRELQFWFSRNGLSLNQDKSEAIVIETSARRRHETNIDQVMLNDACISVSKSVKSLGVTIDHTLSFNQHVNNTCKAAGYHIKALQCIRRFIDEDTAKIIESSMVGSRLDYCISLIYCTSDKNVDKLQRVQTA